jgi:phosphatidylglycerol lysyltransferase
MRKWIPRFIAILVGLAGVMSLISAMLPGAYDRLVLLREFVPLEVRSVSRILTLLSGFILIILAQNLWARKRRAWWLAIAILGLSFVTHLTKAFDFEEALATLIPLFLLLRYHALFSVASARLNPFQIGKRIAVVLAILTLYAGLGYTLLQTQFMDPVRPGSAGVDYLYSATGLGRDAIRARTRASHWFENSLGIITTAAGLVILVSLFAPLLERSVPTDEERETVRSLALQSDNSVAYYATMPDKQYYWNLGGTHVLAYQTSMGVAVVLGEPLGLGGIESALSEATEHFEKRGLGIALYNVTASFALRAEALGYHLLKVGEEAVIPLDAFDLAGSRMAEIRHAVARMDREGLHYEWYTAADLPWSTLESIDDLHTTWISQKNMPPMTFSMEYYPFPIVSEVSILAIKNSAGKIWGALSFLPYGEGKGVTLDFMLRSAAAHNGMMEAAIFEAINHFRSLGVQDLNLGLAPLANTSKAFLTLFNNFNHFYQFKSLYKFKDKFAPVWVPKYIVTGKKLTFPKAALAIISVHLKKHA